MEGYIGEMRWFSANFAPRNWAYCQGQIMSIAQNTALFSILGTTYGGNGQTTFALPDLRGRVAVGTGLGQGITSFELGELTGSPTNTLLVTNLPSHNHTATGVVRGNSMSASQNAAAGGFPAAAMGRDMGTGAQVQVNMYGTPFDTSGAGNSVQVNVGVSGSNTPINNQQPSLGMNYIICLYGIYPSRG